MDIWPPAPIREMPVLDRVTINLAAWSLGLTVGGVLLASTLVVLLSAEAHNPGMSMAEWMQKLAEFVFFLVCPASWLAGLVLGIRERQNPVARISIVLAVLALLLMVSAVVFPMLQTV